MESVVRLDLLPMAEQIAAFRAQVRSLGVGLIFILDATPYDIELANFDNIL